MSQSTSNITNAQLKLHNFKIPWWYIIQSYFKLAYNFAEIKYFEDNFKLRFEIHCKLTLVGKERKNFYHEKVNVLEDLKWNKAEKRDGKKEERRFLIHEHIDMKFQNHKFDWKGRPNTKNSKKRCLGPGWETGSHSWQ